MDRYFFIHVPKAAGTSMFRIFRDLLGTENVGPMLTDFNQAGVETVSEYRLLGGHLGFHQLKHFGERRVFTMLRHPVDCVISRYYYHRGLVAGASVGPEVQASRDLLLDELVAEGHQNALRFYFNTAVWQLAGMGFAGYRGGSETEALRLAKDHLAQCDFVGILEQIEDSLDLMSYTFGWPPVVEIPLENATSGRVRLEQVDSGLRQRIKERSCLDMELYDYGLSLFTKQKRGMMRAALGQRSADPPPAVAPPVSTSGTAASVAVGTGRVTIVHTEVLNSEGRSGEICSGETCTVRVLLSARENADCVTIGLTINNNYGQTVFGCRSSAHGVQFSMGAGDIRDVQFRVFFRLAMGKYTLNITAFKSDWSKVSERLRPALAGEPEEVYDCLVGAATVFVTRLGGPRFYGVCDLSPSVRAEGDRALAERFECAYSRPIVFSASGPGTRHLCAGWSSPEEGGTWTVDHAAHMLFGLRRFPNRDVVLKATVQAFCPESFPSLTAEVIVNGQPLSVWRIEGNATRVLSVCIPAVMTRSPFLHLLFRIHDPRSPAAAGVSTDQRLLGIGLHQMEFCDTADGIESVRGAAPA